MQQKSNNGVLIDLLSFGSGTKQISRIKKLVADRIEKTNLKLLSKNCIPRDTKAFKICMMLITRSCAIWTKKY